MTRNYMHQWRENRRLANHPCECGNVPRIAYDKGCARCEKMDQDRYRQKSPVDAVCEALGRFDSVSTLELSEACGLRLHQTWRALKALVREGKAENVSPTEYRRRRRAA